jgi:cytoskeletal protein RodZ
VFPSAGGDVQDRIGVGAALTKARMKRGLTLDEASRDTRIRVDQLRALEDEDFDQLAGEVYVRGSLRTYAQYLGLSPDKVLGLYARHAEDPVPLAPPPSPMGSVERTMTASRFRDNQRLVVLGAVTLLILAVVFGVLSRQRSSPAAAMPTAIQQPELDRSITADVVANREAAVTVTIDGSAPRTASLSRGEAVSFEAASTLEIRIADGGSVQLTVNGGDLGSPGTAGKPWVREYSFESGGPTPSPGP